MFGSVFNTPVAAHPRRCRGYWECYWREIVPSRQCY